MAIDRDADRNFEGLARALGVQDGLRKTKIADSIDEGFDSLDVDPYLFSRDDEDEYNGDSRMYVRDYSRPSTGYASQTHSFWLPLNDLGDGQVDIRAYAGFLNGQQGTFTRATIATCRLKSGLLKKVASGVPRSHYLASGAYGGYLAEGGRTNTCLRSEEFDNAAWSKQTITVIADDAVAPDGTLTADRLTSTGDAGSLIQQTVAAGATAVHSASVWLKQRGGLDQGNAVAFYNVTTASNLWIGTLNFSTGDLTITGGNGTATAESWGNGWWRVCLVSAPAEITAGNDIRLYVGFVGTINTNTHSCYAWGAQIEAGDFASSYLPTTTASVPRAADILTFPLNAISQPQGAAYAELSLSPDGRTDYVGVFLGSAANGYPLFGGGTAVTTISISDGGASPVKAGLSSLSTGVRKRASTWGPNYLAATGDGLAVSSNASYLGQLGTGLSALLIGTSGSVDQPYGTIQNVRLWDRQLPDATLQSLTA